ncbi:MAG: hypothetical protein N2517_09010 [Ignavibacteria bacterium]|nr:hypothetical protein [Ignavibacteria bacterium]
MKKGDIISFLIRNGVAILGMVFVLNLLKIESPEVRAILLAVLFEFVAILFSGISAFVYTKIQFTEKPETPNLGLIFLAVHLCFGLSILSVYLAQFTE